MTVISFDISDTHAYSLDEVIDYIYYNLQLQGHIVEYNMADGKVVAVCIDYEE